MLTISICLNLDGFKVNQVVRTIIICDAGISQNDDDLDVKIQTKATSMEINVIKTNEQTKTRNRWTNQRLQW